MIYKGYQIKKLEASTPKNIYRFSKGKLNGHGESIEACKSLIDGIERDKGFYQTAQMKPI